MNWIVPAVLTLAGFAAIALSMKKHHKPVFDTFPTPARSRLLQAFGWLALVFATVWCTYSFGVGYGLVVETALLNAAGLAVALTLTYRYMEHGRPRGVHNL